MAYTRLIRFGGDLYQMQIPEFFFVAYL